MSQLLVDVLAMLALPCQFSHCSQSLCACLRQSVHVLQGPRIQSLYALCMLHANAACVLQVA